MTPFAENATRGHLTGRLARLPFVLLLTVGLLMSLIHCASCDMAFAGDASATTLSSNDASPPDVPEQALPCHSGHCLSHVNAQAGTAVTISPDFAPRAPLFLAQQSPAGVAGLPLFKPPRA